MLEKKKYLAILGHFHLTNSLTTTHNYTIKKLSENFEKIYYINSENLIFFSKTYSHDLNKIKNEFPENFVLFNPKNSKEFKKFLDDKDLLIINNFGQYFPSIKIHYLLKKLNIKQILITSVGQINWTQTTNSKYFLKTIFYKIKKMGPKISLILANIGLIAKVEIRFISNKTFLENIKKNKVKNFLYNKNFFFAKELIVVNSIANDILLEEKKNTSEDYIVHLDYNLNHYHEIELRGVMDQKNIEEHYFYLQKILKKLSSYFNKEVKICIHPAYNIKEHQKNLPDFEVIQFRTRELIYKAFLVTLFDSSAVIDAVLLKKNIIGLTSDIMGENGARQSQAYSNMIGYLNVNTKNEIEKKEELLNIMKKNIKNYDNYINNYISFDKSILGMDKIIDIIKERYFR
tara:strand:- start:1716 stop:2921 length:1206 start_codon:yes stop_codon:yes gene_type:complete